MSTPTLLQNFVSLSANVKQILFDYISAQAPKDFDRLLTIYAANAAEPPATIADIIFNRSGSDICFLARSVMLAWYLGSWYAPADLAARRSTNVVISSIAYTQGWSWNVAQAHPMGYSNFKFGYWAASPPSLADFVGGAAR
jgi:hypothetical protein